MFKWGRYKSVKFKDFIKNLYDSISKNQTTDQAAQLAYWSVLAFFPFAIFLLTVIGFIPMQGIDRQLMEFIYRVMPHDAAQLVDQTLHEIVGKKRGVLLALGLIGAVWSASSGVGALITSLNRAYEVQETRPFWKVKLISLLTTLGSAALIIVAIVALAVGPGIAHKITDLAGLGSAFDRIWAWARWPVIVASLMFMMASVYYLLPNVKQRFRIISPGSVTAVLLWIGASLGFNFYVSHFGSYAVTYGALGTGIILLTWLYISGLVGILGGEINALLDRMIQGMSHTEQVAGPITQPDRGKEKGDHLWQVKQPDGNASPRNRNRRSA